MDADVAKAEYIERAEKASHTDPNDGIGEEEYYSLVAARISWHDYFCPGCDRGHNEDDFCWGACGEQVSLGEF
ncbi:hypothetical protein OB920_13325 [Halobacteria archaeon HArc-gm2]|nr:hypothetical protein [Halobacteria archaeon HArc-gm2]